MKRFLYSVIFFTLFLGEGLAQRTSVSPYSSFGLGEGQLSNGAPTFGMGSISSAYISPFGAKANFINPAANLNLSHTSFTFEGALNASRFDDGTQKANRSAAYISRMSLAFPMGKKWAGGFSFQPYSSTGYNISDISAPGTTPTTVNNFVGEGGINTLRAFTSFKIVPELALGLRVDFLFGDMTTKELFSSSTTTLITSYKNKNEVTGFLYTAGLAYSKPLKNNHRFTLGLNYQPQLNLTSDRSFVISTYLTSLSTGLPINEDIVYQTAEDDARMRIPQKIGFGMSYGKDYKWSIAGQLDWTQTSSLNINNQRSTLNDSFRAALGGYIIPKFNSYKSYWQRASYRGGAFYERTPISIEGTDIKKYGITFGLGLPVGKSNDPSELNLGVELGQQGTVSSNTVKESFMNFKLSFTLNDTWFQKRKYD